MELTLTNETLYDKVQCLSPVDKLHLNLWVVSESGSHSYFVKIYREVSSFNFSISDKCKGDYCAISAYQVNINCDKYSEEYSEYFPASIFSVDKLTLFNNKENLSNFIVEEINRCIEFAPNIIDDADVVSYKLLSDIGRIEKIDIIDNSEEYRVCSAEVLDV